MAAFTSPPASPSPLPGYFRRYALRDYSGLLGLSLVAISLGACGNAPSTEDSEQSFLDRYARAFCKATLCNDQTGATLEECTKILASSTGDSPVARSENLSFSPENGKKCLTSLDDTRCEAPSTATRICASVYFAPKGTEGQACVGEAYCASSDLFCNTGKKAEVLANCSGVCEKKIGEGENCELPSSCQDGLVCFSECVKPIAEGNACDPNGVPCDLGLICGAAGTTDETVCKPLYPEREAKLGEDCSSSKLCVVGAYCSLEGATGTCVGPAEKGGECDTTYPDQCPVGQFCRVVFGSASKCTDYASAGDDCDEELPCKKFLECVNGTCVVPKALGESCTADGECWSNYCNADKTCEGSSLACY